MDRHRIVRTMFRPGSPMLETAELEHQEDGIRNEHGVFLPAAPTITTISVVTAPVDGEEREILAVGLRSEELRTFWIKAAVQGVDDAHDAVGRSQALKNMIVAGVPLEKALALSGIMGLEE